MSPAQSGRDQRVARVIDREVAPVWHDRFARLILQRLPTVSGSFVLDVHCGPGRTTRELLQRFFPGRSDVHRLLMEPIAYANGSTLDDPAISYGIVFSNFMSKGVYIFQGGTDKLIRLMKAELKNNGVDLRQQVQVERIAVEDGRVRGVVADGRSIAAAAVLSNANLKTTQSTKDPSHATLQHC